MPAENSSPTSTNKIFSARSRFMVSPPIHCSEILGVGVQQVNHARSWGIEIVGVQWGNSTIQVRRNMSISRRRVVKTNAGVGRKAILQETQPSWRWLRIGFWACIVISVAVVLRRTIALAHPQQSAPPQLAELDAAFASHAALTLAHILPALAFVLLTPFVYIRRFARAAWPKRFLFPLGLVVGVTAYAMSRYSVGGWVERSAVQQSVSIFALSGMAVASRAGAELAMDDTGHCNPPRHRNYPPGDGNIFRHQSCHSSFP